MRLIILGAPGAGKGTQAEVLSKKLDIPTISTGEIIRNAIRQGTDLGKEAKQYIDRGLLVPDDVVIEIVKDRLTQDDCKNGFILDGFPRTVPQADALTKMGVTIDKVLSIEVAEEKIVERISGRRQCSKCGATYHIVYKPSKEENICDLCGGELIMRQDDAPETVKNRLKVYHEQTEPLKDYYQSKGLLVVAYGQEEVADTTKEVLKALGVV
ncbi:MAG: adenylate kinase [Petroclostridium sp.]|jgi:adenylate kinase|uniref:adenylate kinase n=1 Tax=Petroclostridium xylanilyticum TaxID=1792311 RepID=UPI000B98CA86|nr:adenylate kinase [Petroclostridium xylanilyticum]MBZ4645212.1 adk [Clostridia bacterium]MDK2809720.1 adenylate kinase [Petroclostridium sp.]